MHFAVLTAFSRSDVMQKCGERPRKAVPHISEKSCDWVSAKPWCLNTLCVCVGGGGADNRFLCCGPGGKSLAILER